MNPYAKLLHYSSSVLYTPLNARTIGCNRMPTRKLKQHFSPKCRRLFNLSLNQSMYLCKYIDKGGEGIYNNVIAQNNVTHY